jgi:U32 family peptidase
MRSQYYYHKNFSPTADTHPELLISCKSFSRFVTMSKAEMLEASEDLKSKSLGVILDIDVLVEENLRENFLQELRSLPENLLQKVRLLDTGLIYFFKTHFPQTKIQLTLEIGNHNFWAIKTWISFLGESLDRLILSYELPKDKIESYIKSFPEVKFELLVLGRILLFTTPRKLVGHLLEEEERARFGQERIEILASSEESAHKGFPIIENSFGTYMFNTKDLSLLAYLDELRSLGLQFARFDLRFDECENNWASLQKVLVKELSAEDFLSVWPRKTLPGFFKVNRTDVLFKKLKNSHLQDRNEEFLGEVVDYQKGEFLAVMLRPGKTLQASSQILLKSTDGKEKLMELSNFKNADGENVAKMTGPSLALLPALASYPPGSFLYLNTK